MRIRGGCINGNNSGTITLKEVIQYVESKTNTMAVFDSTGEDGPYNGAITYSINTNRANQMGFHFSNLSDWIYQPLDAYIDMVK